MYRSSAKRLSALIVSVVAVFSSALRPRSSARTRSRRRPSGRIPSRLTSPTKVRISAPLRDHLKRPGPAGPTLKEGRDKPPMLTHAPSSVARPKDPAIKSAVHPPNMPDPIADFEGQLQTCGCYPPDTNAAVGPSHIWQIVNLESQVFDHDGNAVSESFETDSMWSGFGGPCETTNDGDPIVKYDQLSDRWIISQFAIEQTPSLQCFAVSVTNDPLGEYYQSAYSFGPIFNDYPEDLDHAGRLLPDGPPVQRGVGLGHRGLRPRGDDRRRPGHRDLLRHQPGLHLRRLPGGRPPGNQPRRTRGRRKRSSASAARTTTGRRTRCCTSSR